MVIMAEPTIQEIKKIKDKIEDLGLGGNNHELFVKALIMAERDIQDLDTLDKAYQTYYNHDISLLNDLIIEQE